MGGEAVRVRAGDAGVEDETAGGQVGEEAVVLQALQADEQARHGDHQAGQAGQGDLSAADLRRLGRLAVRLRVATRRLDGRHRRRPGRPAAQKLREMLIMAGPMTTTNNAGKMQNTMGMSILTGAF